MNYYVVVDTTWKSQWNKSLGGNRSFKFVIPLGNIVNSSISSSTLHFRILEAALQIKKNNIRYGPFLQLLYIFDHFTIILFLASSQWCFHWRSPEKFQAWTLLAWLAYHFAFAMNFKTSQDVDTILQIKDNRQKFHTLQVSIAFFYCPEHVSKIPLKVLCSHHHCSIVKVPINLVHFMNIWKSTSRFNYWREWFSKESVWQNKV